MRVAQQGFRESRQRFSGTILTRVQGLLLTLQVDLNRADFYQVCNMPLQFGRHNRV